MAEIYREFSEFDKKALKLIRQSVDQFIAFSAYKHDQENNLILDVAPQDHKGAKAFYKKATIQTLDVNPNAGADFTYDLCSGNFLLPKNKFDAVICTEVLEHTLNPFMAVKELHSTLKDSGKLYVTTPFNFRMHGPAPDCWRFTDAGLRSLLSEFKVVEIDELETPDRHMMPIQFRAIAIK